MTNIRIHVRCRTDTMILLPCQINLVSISPRPKLKVFVIRILTCILFLVFGVRLFNQIYNSHLFTLQWVSLEKSHGQVTFPLQVLQLDSTVRTGEYHAFLAPFSTHSDLFLLFSDSGPSYPHSHLALSVTLLSFLI